MQYCLSRCLIRTPGLPPFGPRSPQFRPRSGVFRPELVRIFRRFRKYVSSFVFRPVNTSGKPMAPGPGETAPEAPRTRGHHENKANPYDNIHFYIQPDSHYVHVAPPGHLSLFSFSEVARTGFGFVGGRVGAYFMLHNSASGP